MVVGRHGVDMVAVPGLVAEVTRRGLAAVIIPHQTTSVVTNTVWTVVTTKHGDVTQGLVHVNIAVLYIQFSFDTVKPVFCDLIR